MSPECESPPAREPGLWPEPGLMCSVQSGPASGRESLVISTLLDGLNTIQKVNSESLAIRKSHESLCYELLSILDGLNGVGDLFL